MNRTIRCLIPASRFPLLACFLLSCASATPYTIAIDEDASPRIEYAAQRLSQSLKSAGHSAVISRHLPGIQAERMSSEPSSLSRAAPAKTRPPTLLLYSESSASASSSSVSRFPDFPISRFSPESFHLQTLPNGRVLVTGADDSGLLYGALELASRIRAAGRLPDALDLTETPALKLRGPCIGMQKTFILPGRKVYEYPYTPELFPFFYDRAFWDRYLDFLADNRFNTLYLWNGHPFASLLRLPDYPYAVEVPEEVLAKNMEMFRYIAREADRRGIWVVQMFYSIILSKPFAEHNGIATQLAAPLPVANDYMRKSIAEFVRQYPNVGLMACLGEALQGIENQKFWFNEVILPGVKDGMLAAGLTKEPPVVIRTHATDLTLIMPDSLKIYSNLYTEAKFNGESLTTWEPRGKWQQTHLKMSHLGSTHLANVHILANLEPFRYGAERFIQKSVLAMRDRLGAGGLHLYPLAYWNWPDAPDIAASPLPQIERDWIWFEAWARYAWNPDRPAAAEREHWLQRIASRFGSREAASGILDAYNDSGECAPRLLRRFGITEGNRQTLSLGMTLDQLVKPEKYRPYEELWESQSPAGERLQVYAEREWRKEAHAGETPPQIIAEVLAFSDAAVRSIDAAAPHVTRNREEFERLRNDMRCIQALSHNYVAKARAALSVLRYERSKDPSDMRSAETFLAESLTHYRELARLTEKTYAFANTMQTSQRRIPVSGGAAGKPANYHWTQLLPLYEKEFTDFQRTVASLSTVQGSLVTAPKAAAPLALRPPAQPLRLLTPGCELYTPNTGSRVFTDQPWEIQALSPALAGLNGIRFPSTQGAAASPVSFEFECSEPVDLLVGYAQSKDKAWLQVPFLETDAAAIETIDSEPLLTDAATIDTLPQINLHRHHFSAGRHTFTARSPGAFLILGIAKSSP